MNHAIIVINNLPLKAELRKSKKWGTGIEAYVWDVADDLDPDDDRAAYLAAQESAIAQALAALGISHSEIEFRRKLGCNCGCSPGFKISAIVTGWHELYISKFEQEHFGLAALAPTVFA